MTNLTHSIKYPIILSSLRKIFEVSMSGPRQKKIYARNFDSPFTELFSLLKSYEYSPAGLPKLVYGSDELKVIQLHSENAINALLNGLQGMSLLIGMAFYDKHVGSELTRISFFIATICNLVEALNDLSSDVYYVLNKHQTTI